MRPTGVRDLVMRSPRPLLRATRLVWESAPGWSLGRAALLVLQGLVPLAALYLMKLIVDAVAEGIGAGDPDAAFRRVAVLVLIAAGVGITTIVVRTIATLVGEAQAQVLTDHVHDVLHSKSVEVDLQYYENPEYHDSLHRAQQEAPYRPTRIVTELAQVAQNGVALLAVAGLLISFHWIIAVILLAAVVPAMLVKTKYSRRIYQWQLRQTTAQRQARYFNELLTADSYAKEIRLFHLGELFRGRFRDVSRRVRRERIAIATRRSLAEMVAQVSAIAAIFASFAFIAYRTVNGDNTLGDMVMYFGAFQRAQDHFREALAGVAGLYEDNLFLSDLFRFLDLEPRVPEPARPQALPKPMRAGIVLDHVAFRYPGSSRDALIDVSLEIRPGEHVALVGENGSGKTTLVKLLCRLYDPTSGSIRIDGIDLREFAIGDLRSEIGVIFQDFARYHLTALDNIGFGNVEFAADRERIVAAARETGAADVIERLKYGYDTILGKRFGDGAELSIGEWQKVALARAFLRDSLILVLDEPTSALDARAEYEVFRRFHQLAADRTAILISHRLSTVRMVDRIYVLQDGGIVESGVHDELMGRGGTYARLFEMQAQYYR
ncbi:MAG: ABC transporter ATP-binding protein [Longimicrobiales bacterium]